MSVAELAMWQDYVNENGMLNLALRIDAAIARALLPFLKQGTKMKDLMPYPKPKEDINELFGIFKGLARG